MNSGQITLSVSDFEKLYVSRAAYEALRAQYEEGLARIEKHLVLADQQDVQKMEDYLAVYERMQTLEGLLAVALDLLRRALTLANTYKATHEKWVFQGTTQDPLGSHALAKEIPGLMARIRAVLGAEGGEG